MIKKTPLFWILSLILIISLFFRFYNYKNFQFWTSDEEIAAAVVRRIIVEGKPALISPNITIATSLGPFFHLLSVPLFLASNLNPIPVLFAMGFVGILTTIMIFLTGKLVNKNLGLIASFLYASSFVVGLFDRRWWPLSLNPLLVSCAIYSLYQIITFKKYWFCLLLAVSIGFAAHADPSLGIIALSTIFIFIFLKIPMKRKEYFGGFIVLLIFVSPLLLFEIRHPGTILNPLTQALHRGTNLNLVKPAFNLDFFTQGVSLFARLIAVKPSNFAEIQLVSGFNATPPLFPLFTKSLAVLFFLFPFYKLLEMRKKNLSEKKFLVLLYIFLFSFIGASLLYSLSFKRIVHQNFFSILFPVFFLLAAYTIQKLPNKKLIISFLLIYFLVNAHSMIGSSVKYPLYQKLQVVSEISSKLDKLDFSLYVQGDEFFNGSGFTELFILANKYPKKSYIYPFYDWMYQAYSLYAIEPENKDQEKIVIIQSSESSTDYKNVEFSTKIGGMKALLLDNSSSWFNESNLR